MDTFEQKNSKTLNDENSFEFLNGLWTGKKPPYTEAVVIRNTNFRNDGRVDYSNVAVLDVEIRQLEKRRLQKGDIIVERSGGGPKQPVGRVVYFDKESSEIDYSFSNFTSAIRIKGGAEFDSRFVFYFLHNFYLEGKTDQLQRRTTGIRNLDFTSYKDSIVFPNISVTTQKSIADILNTTQRTITEQEQLIFVLRKLRASLMQHLLTHGTRREKMKMSEIGQIPESWSVSPLSEVIMSLDAGVSVNSQDRPAKENEKGILKTSCVTRGIFDPSQNKVVAERDLARTATPLKSDTIILSRMNTPDLVGACAYVQTGNDLLFLPDRLWQITLTSHESYSMKWLAYQLQSMWKSGKFSEISSGTSASMKNITKSKLLSLRIGVPDISEQNKIASSLSELDMKINLAQRKNELLQSLFKTLLHELMSGERKV